MQLSDAQSDPPLDYLAGHMPRWVNYSHEILAQISHEVVSGYSDVSQDPDLLKPLQCMHALHVSLVHSLRYKDHAKPDQKGNPLDDSRSLQCPLPLQQGLQAFKREDGSCIATHQGCHDGPYNRSKQ